MKSIAIFVDIANLYYCIDRKWPGSKLDYSVLTRSVQGENLIYKATAYGLQHRNEATPFIALLKHLGYEPKYRRPRMYRDAQSKMVERRTSWSMGMAMDIVDATLGNKVDEVVIGSSDGDLAPLVAWLQKRNIKVTIVSCGISQELRRQCQNCIEITEAMLHATPAST